MNPFVKRVLLVKGECPGLSYMLSLSLFSSIQSQTFPVVIVFEGFCPTVHLSCLSVPSSAGQTVAREILCFAVVYLDYLVREPSMCHSEIDLWLNQLIIKLNVLFFCKTSER